MKRGIVAAVAVLACAASMGTATTPAWSDTPTPDPNAVTAYQQNPTHDGHTADSGFVAPLTKAWSQRFPGVVGYPLVVNRVVYVAAGAANGSGWAVEAVSLDTGSLIWGPVSFGTPASTAPITYDNGHVFALNSGGQMLALNAATGATDWAAQLAGQWSFSAPPTASHGVLYVSGAGSGGTLYAVSESDGSVRWTAPVENGDGSSPAVDGTGVYVSYACEQAYGFSTSGAALWHHSTGCEGGGGETAVLHNGAVYVRDHFYGPVALSESSGAVAGLFESATTPVFDGNTMLTESNGTVDAVDVATSRHLWSNGVTNSATPVIANGYAVLGQADGTVQVRYEQNGVIAWQGQADPGSAASAVTTVAEGDGDLLAVADNQLTVFAPVLDQDVTVSLGPNSAGFVTGATPLVFTSPVPNARYVCSLDGASAACTSPYRLTTVPGGRHLFTVSIAYATTGSATQMFTIDRSAPSVSWAAVSPRVSTASSATARWHAFDTQSGVATSDVRYRRSHGSGQLTAWQQPTARQALSTDHVSLPLTVGETVCVSVRARDKVGNTSAWTPQQCVRRVARKR